MLKITKFSAEVAHNLPGVSSNVRQLSCSAVQYLDQKWREAKGLPENPNAFGPLTNLPDYTFLDGRPTPFGSNQKKRLLKQQEITKKIINLSKEIDFAKQRHARLIAEKEAERKRILDSKLKPKGHLLLKKN